MITENLYDEVLIAPARDGASELYVVSGYASAAFAARHLEDVIAVSQSAQVRLLVGMFPQIGNLGINHPAFKRLSSEDFPLRFECRYNIQSPLVHTKVYSWYNGDVPVKGFVGSANYSNNGFENLQREAVAVADPVAIQSYFQKLWDAGLDCREAEADELVSKAIANTKRLFTAKVAQLPDTDADYAGLENVSLPLVDRSGNVPAISGLNWGQRPGREQNQAYLSIPADTAKSDFFPPLKIPFTVLTDDARSLICVRAQPKQKGGDIGYALHSTNNNSELGIYFRNRLGLASGAFVTAQDLENYGRNNVTFYRVADDEYYLDFSRP